MCGSEGQSVSQGVQVPEKGPKFLRSNAVVENRSEHGCVCPRLFIQGSLVAVSLTAHVLPLVPLVLYRPRLGLVDVAP